MLEQKNAPAWHAAFFMGVPAPAGALLGLLPVYVGLLGAPREGGFAVFVALYTVTIAYLMVSNLRTWSGKQTGRSVSRSMALPVMIAVILFFVFLFSYPWWTLTFMCLAYLALIPFSMRDWQKRTDAEMQENKIDG